MRVPAKTARGLILFRHILIIAVTYFLLQGAGGAFLCNVFTTVIILSAILIFFLEIN